jgi:beta-lysine 5,6-aminomutase beta subunit
MAVKSLKNWLFGNEEKKEKKEKAHESVKADLKRLKPYGDHMGDGAIQLSFTLPVPLSPEAKEAARLYAEKLGLERVNVAAAEAMGKGFTLFVVYGFATLAIDFTRIKVHHPKIEKLDYETILGIAQEKIGRKIVVVGATTGSDAHTVGIDAILNRKGYAGDFGLESYPCFQVINLRAQVENSELVKKAVELNADAILVSKLVTQQDQHLKDLKEFLKLLKQEKAVQPHVLKIAGGPRITHPIATKMGFDAGFGTGTLPSEVASFLVQELAKKIKR